MAGVNKVILVGRLGNDPEVRTLPSGGKVATFSLATSENYTDKNGEKVEQTEWHRVDLWENQATVAEKYLKKGDLAYIEGKIRTEKYTDKDGNERYATKIRGNVLQLLGGKSSSSAEQNEVGATPETHKNTGTPAVAAFVSDSSQSDDLPF